MSIHFTNSRWQKIKENYRKWWAGELDRPLIALSLTGYDPERNAPDLPSYGFASFYDKSVPAHAIINRWDFDLSCKRFLGDAFPALWPNFGPGVIAAFIGCRLEKDMNTSWFVPEKEQMIADWHPAFNPDAYWFKRIAGLCSAALEIWQDKVQIGMTDLGGSLDIPSSFRPGEKLLLDLYDHPEEVKRTLWEIHDIWWDYFNAFNAILQPLNRGYTAWTPIYSEAPYYMLQCDFAYMIGPEMFDKFVKPELAATCKRLVNPFYHLDGVGQLVHLDSILSIPGLKGIQWVPGEGQPDTAHWPEVYRKIRSAGKLIQLFGGQSSMNYKIIDTLAEQLGSAKGICLIAEADSSEENEARELLKKYDI